MTWKSNLFVANTNELKDPFVIYLTVKQNRPNMLEYQIRKALHEHGLKVLWMPPYCFLELQPIEMFWAVHKRHAAFMDYMGRTLK
jgi:hypothetical protein